ncbi:MAG: polypeptide deformylase [Firmicutes bacterium]|nr:polypeptide deformylase [Bacillota bacterium]
MAILDIVLEPAEVLRKKAKPVTKISASLRRLMDDMADTMYDAPGVGLAGPQVGVSKRIIVIDPQDDVTGLLYLVNPEIVDAEGWIKGTEGCLSLPGYMGDVYRYEKVKVVALDRNGRKVYYDAEGWLARIFQHEIDHLDGIMYTDKCSNLREVLPGEEENAEGGPLDEDEAADDAVEKAVKKAVKKGE